MNLENQFGIVQKIVSAYPQTTEEDILFYSIELCPSSYSRRVVMQGAHSKEKLSELVKIIKSNFTTLQFYIEVNESTFNVDVYFSIEIDKVEHFFKIVLT